MEAQNLHASEVTDEDNEMSGVPHTESIANSAPEVDVGLSPREYIRGKLIGS
jgi:hypothetical protein